MEESLLSRLDRRIESRSLLTHPFYQAWQAGILSQDDLRAYARQYYFFEANFPRFLSSIHSRCPQREVRQTILDNLWDEEHGEDNHRAMWLAFCRGLGLAEAEVVASSIHPQTQQLLDTYTNICGGASFQEGLAAMYAYEAQVPAVSLEKIRGLVENYGFQRDASLQFFEEHSTLDEEHSAREAAGIIAHTGLQDEPAVESALQKALDAWWGFLDGLENLRTASAAD
jgi:pyrroloquinoline-quinone synthase